jgi:hypothetical protein
MHLLSRPYTRNWSLGSDLISFIFNTVFRRLVEFLAVGICAKRSFAGSLQENVLYTRPNEENRVMTQIQPKTSPTI